MSATSIVKNALERFTYRRRRAPPEHHGPPLYQLMAMTLLSFRSPLRIAVVGANDGAINDPIYSFAMEFRDRISIFLVEPQVDLIPILRKNYEGHPGASIFNGAIGEPGILSLFAVRSEFWQKLDVPYAREWPPYRAPTGITSFSRERVASWLAEMLKPGHEVDDAIRELRVPTLALRSALLDHGLAPALDILQVDAEGADDVVIYNSDIDGMRPALIRFERRGLDDGKNQALSAYLEARGYRIVDDAGDAIAVRTVAG